MRKGNPKGIKDWDDLAKDGVEVITPNPKTSGGARWNYLAAWGYALKQPGGSEATAKELVTKIYKNTKVLDSGARGSTTTFVERGIGDVLIAWENEAYLSRQGARPRQVRDRHAVALDPRRAAGLRRRQERRQEGHAQGRRGLPQLPLHAEGQEIAGKNFYRPRDAKVAEKYAKQFAPVKLFTIDEVFGGWAKAQKTHFDDGGIFDQIYGSKS